MSVPERMRILAQSACWKIAGPLDISDHLISLAWYDDWKNHSKCQEFSKRFFGKSIVRVQKLSNDQCTVAGIFLTNINMFKNEEKLLEKYSKIKQNWDKISWRDGIFQSKTSFIFIFINNDYFFLIDML